MKRQEILGKFKILRKAETVLALVAILFAVIQFLDSRQLIHRIDRLLSEASTRFVGLFPDNLDDINSTLDKTQQELRVLSDYPGYGHYSRPAKFAEYLDKIINLRRERPPKTVRMLFYSSTVQRDSVQDQLKVEDWEKIQTDDKFKDFFGTFHTESEPPKTYEGYVNRLLELQFAYEKKLCNNGVEIEHIAHPSVLFFWLADEDNAVFSINSREGTERELSFHTSDGKLTHSFRTIFDRFWRDSQGDPQRCPPPKQATPAP